MNPYDPARITAARQLIADTRTMTAQQWTNHFLPEGEAYVARRQDLGDYISDPYGTALTYAGMRVFDAMVRGETEVDLSRARQAAEYLCGHTAEREAIQSRRAA